jgi:ribosome biogenesis GTPase A
MTNFWKIVKRVINDADVILLVLDARLVEQTRNNEIEANVKKTGKPLIYVLTKCDLVEKEDAEKWKKILKPCVFISSKDYLGVNLLKERIFIESKKSEIKGSVRVGVLGYPNVGKSSLINALKGKSSATVSSNSGQTRGVMKVRSRGIIFLDTPGVIPYMEKDAVKQAITGTIDFNKAKNPDLIVMEIMEQNPGKIEIFYGVEEKEDNEETIEDIAIKYHLLAKGGKPDTLRAARKILKDWQTGKIK